MKTIRIIFLFAIIGFFITPLQAQYTKQQAIDLVLNNILLNELSQVDVYMLDITKSNQNNILLGDRTTINLPYSNNWVCFVDDNPIANWAHSCRYILIDEASGNYQVVTKNFFPPNWETNYSSISEIACPTPVDLPINPNAVINGLDPNPNLYAVIISGARDNAHHRYFRDISAIYCTLIDVYGYTKENIFVHYDGVSNMFGSDLDGPLELSDDIDYDATKESILHTFSEMAGGDTSPEIPVLGPEDQLFIFVTDHGYIDETNGHSYLHLPDHSNLEDDMADFEMAESLAGINCAQIIAIFEPCFIGGFKTELSDYTNYNVQCKNRYIQTASNVESSYPEFYITNRNYDEFVYYWTAAARGYYPHNNYPWEESYAVGTFPFHEYQWMVDHPGDHNPDLNGDSFVQMDEAFAYAKYMDTWAPPTTGESGYYHPFGSTAAEYPQSFTDISFSEDLLTLSGLAGHIENTQTVENRNYLIGNDLIIDDGYNLTLANGGNYYFGNEVANLTACSGAGLIIEDNVSFHGYNTNEIKIDGDMSIGNNVNFTGEGSAKLDVVLNNTALQVTFDNSTFRNVNLDNFSQELTISNSVFNDYYRVLLHRGNVDISNTDFISGSVQAWILLENTEDNQNVAEISSCNFTTSASLVGIDMWNYKNYYIMDNTISGFDNGIQILQSGYGDTRRNVIGNNTINNCIHKGILSYGSRGSISNNQITNNGYGIWLGNQSDINVYGNSAAISYQQTQVIRDNDSYEVYASKHSFPTLFHYNAIIDDNNIGAPSDPLLYFSGGTDIKDVINNCWEDVSGSFDPAEDLYPTGYVWEPTWCPGGGINGDPDPAKDMYDTANNLFNAEDFLAAKDIYLLLIDQYPQSKFAQSALQELYALEKFVSNDYSSLKDYFATDNTIQTNQELTKTGDYLVSKCDVKLNNWSGAIEYYEDIILNPESMEDSIFAIVDLGYVYYNMENSENKSIYTGSLTQYKPRSQKQFFEDRDYLLSLIPKNAQLRETLKENLDGLTTGELLQNVPNPFKGSTQIYYKLNTESNVKLSVYNYTGQLIKTYKEGTKTKGIHHIDFDANGLQNGIYLYSISINGQITDSKKMTIMK